MPGSSLWLLPPPTHPLYSKLQTLISSTIPTLLFPPPSSTTPPSFSPHVTLTSEINPSIYGDNPQQWLDSLSWPKANGVGIKFEGVRTEDVFFRRCYLKVRKEDGIKELAALARGEGVLVGKGKEAVREWVDESYMPHCSLMYADSKLDDQQLDAVEKVVHEHEISLSGQGEYGGWKGGIVWLVPTDRPIDQWTPIAFKKLE